MIYPLCFLSICILQIFMIYLYHQEGIKSRKQNMKEVMIMNTEYEFQYGTTGKNDWQRIIVISAKHIFYDMLTENGVKVVTWCTAQKLPTYAEIDDEYLPTGRVFQLISSRNTNLPETGGFNP